MTVPAYPMHQHLVILSAIIVSAGCVLVVSGTVVASAPATCPAIKVGPESEMQQDTPLGKRIFTPCPGQSQGAMELICCGPGAAGKWDGAGMACISSHSSRWMRPAQDTCNSALVQNMLEDLSSRGPTNTPGAKSMRRQRLWAGMEHLLDLLSTRALRLGTADIARVVRLLGLAVQQEALDLRTRANQQRHSHNQYQHQHLQQILAVLSHASSSTIKMPRTFAAQDLVAMADLLAGIHHLGVVAQATTPSTARNVVADLTQRASSVLPPDTCGDAHGGADAAVFRVTWREAAAAISGSPQRQRQQPQAMQPPVRQDQPIQPPQTSVTTEVVVRDQSVCEETRTRINKHLNKEQQTQGRMQDTSLAPSIVLLRDTWTLLPHSGAMVTPLVSVSLPAINPPSQARTRKVSAALPIQPSTRLPFTASQAGWCSPQDVGAIAAELSVNCETGEVLLKCIATDGAEASSSSTRVTGRVPVSVECRQFATTAAQGGAGGWTTEGCALETAPTPEHVVCSCESPDVEEGETSTAPLIMAAFVAVDDAHTPAVPKASTEATTTPSSTSAFTTRRATAFVGLAEPTPGTAGGQEPKHQTAFASWSFARVITATISACTIAVGVVAFYCAGWVCCKLQVDGFSASSFHLTAAFLALQIVYFVHTAAGALTSNTLCQGMSAALTCFALTTLLWTTPLVLSSACRQSQKASGLQSHERKLRVCNGSSALVGMTNWVLPVILVVGTALLDSSLLTASDSVCRVSFTGVNSAILAGLAALSVAAQIVSSARVLWPRVNRTRSAIMAVAVCFSTTLSVCLLGLFASFDHPALALTAACFSMGTMGGVLVMCCGRNAETQRRLRDAPLLKYFAMSPNVPLHRLRLQRPSTESFNSPLNLAWTGASCGVFSLKRSESETKTSFLGTPTFDPSFQYTTPAACGEQRADSGSMLPPPSPVEIPSPLVRPVWTQPRSSAHTCHTSLSSAFSTRSTPRPRNNPLNTPQCSPDQGDASMHSFHSVSEA